MTKKPETQPFAMTELLRYAQIRCLYDVGQVWEPGLASAAGARR